MIPEPDWSNQSPIFKVVQRPKTSYFNSESYIFINDDRREFLETFYSKHADIANTKILSAT